MSLMRVPDWDSEEENFYQLRAVDTLGILSSTKRVVEVGESVWINHEHIDTLSYQWTHQKEQVGRSSSKASLWDTQYHFHDGTKRTVNWLLVLDALNFCFWPDKGQLKWTIEYHDEMLDGYWAEAAALKRAVEEDAIPLWDAQYLTTLSEDVLAHIFRGNGVIPLLTQRLHNAREVGRVLLERYNGDFSIAIEKAGRDALEIARLLAEYFPSFRDIATYRGQEVRFLKRAQIYVADLHGAFAGQAWGNLVNMEGLTIFADYKLPQVLRHAKILEYKPILARRVDSRELLWAGSEEEVEIRANTIWACELLRQSLEKRGNTMMASEIDQKLWLLGQQSEDMQPYHRTRTIYY